MTPPPIAELLDDLDASPIGHLTVRVRGLDLDYRQRQAWYYELRRGGRIVKRGLLEEPATQVEIEDLLLAIKT